MTAKEALAACADEGISLSEYALRSECEATGSDREAVLARLNAVISIMEDSCSKGLIAPLISASGLTGGQSFLYKEYVESGSSLMSDVMSGAIMRSFSAAEVNASMGKIVACPTAGSCGIVPGVLLSVYEHKGKNNERLVDALLASGLVGQIIGDKATLAGAQGGCQAECGSAAGMAAAGAVVLMGGSPEQAFHAASIAIKNLLGLVCDPVAGLVEIPCIKRNAVGAAIALSSADLALSGVTSYIPFDDVVSALSAVGDSLPSELRETAMGGLAATQAGRELGKRIYEATKEQDDE